MKDILKSLTDAGIETKCSVIAIINDYSEQMSKITGENKEDIKKRVHDKASDIFDENLKKLADSLKNNSTK